MLQYILECISFQLVFLVIYDFFLKKETFFQWNRLYLLGTHILSLILPWVKIEAFKTEVPTEYFVYPEFLWNMDLGPITDAAKENSIIDISWQQGVFFLGLLGATLLFGYKMHQLYRLRKNGDVHYFPDFTRIIVANSNLAFSFFKSIFLGDKVFTKEQENIIKHELVHIQQKHSWDLLFFELLRIVFWFNPLVYVYQNRISELHEFIADAHVAKTNKKEQYQLLLSQVFQTQHISFVNQFFKTSLIKKRIAMLRRSQSKKIWQLKYLLLIPMILGMLAYTSSETKENDFVEQEQISKDEALIDKVTGKIEKEVEELGSLEKVRFRYSKRSHFADSEGPILSKEDYFESAMLFKISMQEMSKEMIEKLGTQYRDFTKRIPLPSTARYESYVRRKKAFNILDNNLRFSISSNSQYEVLDVMLINKKGSYPEESYVFNVKNASDLTGSEVRAFNNKLEEVFEKESSYDAIIITDDEYAFHVYKRVIEESSINGMPSMQSSDIAKTNTRLDGKEKDEFVDVPFAVVDQVPVFPGCEDEDSLRECFQKNMQKHISKNFRYPEEAQNLGIQGRVGVIFIIDEKGDITKVRTKGPHKLLEDEAERIIGLLPKMTPGKHDGKTVNIPFSIPIVFKLGSEYTEQRKEFQNPQDNLDVPFAIVDEVPVFSGCESNDDKRSCFQEKLFKHISKNFRYPEEAQKKGIQGRVSILFIIDEVGNIANIRKRGPDRLLEEEAARIISLLPKMKPGIHNGKEVRVPYSIPITFKLQGDENNLEKLDGIEKENSPLVLIDGKESTQMEVYELQKNNMIKSISVIKDKSKLSVYGNKGKNGVVEVSSKKVDTKTIEISAHIKNEDKKHLSGKVTDGMFALPGVNIIVQGAQRAVVSDFDGEFTIEVQIGDVITFQYIGLPTAALKVTSQEKYLVTASE